MSDIKLKLRDKCAAWLILHGSVINRHPYYMLKKDRMTTLRWKSRCRYRTLTISNEILQLLRAKKQTPYNNRLHAK
jgi:hypothetical protein